MKEAKMTKIAANEYKCAACGGVFEKGWSDEEAAAELNARYGGIPVEACDVICDDCYNKMGLGD